MRECDVLIKNLNDPRYHMTWICCISDSLHSLDGRCVFLPVWHPPAGSKMQCWLVLCVIVVDLSNRIHWS